MEVVPDAAITVDTSDGVSAVLIAGGGIGISPTYIAAPHVARGELVPILEDYALDRSSVTAVWPESRRHSPNVKAVLHSLPNFGDDIDAPSRIIALELFSANCSHTKGLGFLRACVRSR